MIALVATSLGLRAQYVYTIKADSVKITNCDSAELILENHTQGVSGFLFNTGNGRTVFKRGAQKLTDTSYLVGGDTVKWRNNAWVQGGNAFGATGVLGTTDSNHLDLYTSNRPQARITKTGNFLIGSTTDNSYRFQVNGSAFINAPIRESGVLIPLVLGGAGSFGAQIGFITHGVVMQSCCTSSFFQFRFGGDTSLLGTGGVKAINLDARNGDNITISSPSNYIDIVDLENIITTSSPITLTSGGQSGQDGVVITRDTRDTARVDPLLSVKEFDTVVFRVCKSGNIGMGTTSPQAQLHTTGSVRFAGLTSDTTQTRVLVSDASGNLFYRSASSLADNQLIRSSLAVNGPIKAKTTYPHDTRLARLRIRQHLSAITTD
ncbi:hypothetical protein ACQ86N_41265 [Puia sp. P3]|uniref:hypothetical protein n=1 Tax=Puia sp. P3 TaxID=3423952 RepID=UPI003D66EA87